MSGHQYRNLKFFSYDSQKAIEGADAGKRTMNDWNRQINAGSNCIYYINGVQLSAVRKTEFADVAELKQFFKKNLFNNMPGLSTKRQRLSRVVRKTPKQATSKRHQKKSKPKIRAVSSSDRANLAAEQACLHWHQAGIQHATYQHANKYTLENFPKIGLPEPKSRVNFDTVKGGVKITEENTIKAWNENNPKGGAPKKHTLGETESYYAKTHTSYLFTPENIQVQDLVIDCPSKALAPIFDSRPQSEQGNRIGNSFLRSLYSFVSRFAAKTPQATYDITNDKADERDQKTIELTKPKGG